MNYSDMDGVYKSDLMRMGGGCPKSVTIDRK